MRRTQWPVLYLVLGALVVVAAAISQLLPDSEMAQRFGPNIATETLGILLTLVFVQRFLERQDRVRRLRSSLGALRRGSRALTRLVEAWATLVKGGLRHPPRYPPDSMLELLEPHHTQALAEIDPGAPVDGTDGLTRGAWIARELRAARSSLRDVVRGYGTTLDAEYVEALDALLDDEFYDLFVERAEEPVGDPAEWSRDIRQLSGAREVHFRRLRTVVAVHDRLAQEAASIRDPKRLPQTRGVGVDLPADWDLRVHHAPGSGWWKDDPPPGTLRTGATRPTGR